MLNFRKIMAPLAQSFIGVKTESQLGFCAWGTTGNICIYNIENVGVRELKGGMMMLTELDIPEFVLWSFFNQSCGHEGEWGSS